MSTIKNIIFDLGGVLLNIDFNRTTHAFTALGVQDFENLYSKESASPLFEELETGRVSNENFLQSLQQYCKPGTTREEVQKAWNSILVSFRVGSIQQLWQLKNKYNIFLLSNTNRIHHTAFHQMYRDSFNNKEFDDCFTKAFYSHLMGKRKPYAATYRYMAEQANIKISETLFIDDALSNIEGAVEAGLHTQLLKAGETIEMLGL